VRPKGSVGKWLKINHDDALDGNCYCAGSGHTGFVVAWHFVDDATLQHLILAEMDDYAHPISTVHDG
jgi:hypothetical protein